MNSFPSNLIISFEYNFFPRLFSSSPFNSTSTSCKKYLASPPEPMKPSNFHFTPPKYLKMKLYVYKYILYILIIPNFYVFFNITPIILLLCNSKITIYINYFKRLQTIVVHIKNTMIINKFKIQFFEYHYKKNSILIQKFIFLNEYIEIVFLLYLLPILYIKFLK